MHRVTLRHPGLPVYECQLRPTHIRMVMAEMSGTPSGSELGFSVGAVELSAACYAVRDRYRCRDVRKELARVIRLCACIRNDKANSPWVRISCEDTRLMRELLEKYEAAIAA